MFKKASRRGGRASPAPCSRRRTPPARRQPPPHPPPPPRRWAAAALSGTRPRVRGVGLRPPPFRRSLAGHPAAGATSCAGVLPAARPARPRPPLCVLSQALSPEPFAPEGPCRDTPTPARPRAAAARRRASARPRAFATRRASLQACARRNAALGLPLRRRPKQTPNKRAVRLNPKPDYAPARLAGKGCRLRRRAAREPLPAASLRRLPCSAIGFKAR